MIHLTAVLDMYISYTLHWGFNLLALLIVAILVNYVKSAKII